jgi:hypothetical protein
MKLRQEFNDKARLRPAALRALNFAQGQMAVAQQRSILFLVALVLEHVREGALGGFDIGAVSPHTEKLLPALAPCLDADGGALAALMDYDVRNHLRAAGPALSELAAFCAARVEAQGGGEDMFSFRRAAALLAATAQYLAMAQDVAASTQYGGAPERGNIRRLARLDPFVTARFIGEYLPLCADAAEGTAHEFPLREARARLMGALRGAPALAGAAPSHIQQVMMMISDAGDGLRAAHRGTAAACGASPCHAAFNHLFQVSAAYDWEQYERGLETPPRGAARPGL